MNARVLVVEQEDGAGLGWLGEWLPAAGLTLEIVRPHAGDDVPTDADHDGLIVLGGAPSAWEDDRAPWLPAVRDLLKRSVAAERPTLGICLGAQLLTLACGGVVERGAAGPEVGAVPVTVTAHGDPLLGGLPSPAWFVQWHFDAVTVPPPGAVTLASSSRYPHQAYRIGRAAWAVQFHPEVTAQDVTAWARQEAERLRATCGIDVEAVLAEIMAREPRILRDARRFADAFAAIVRGTD